MKRIGIADDAWRAKKRGETDLQWRTRIAQIDTEQRDREAPLVTPEAEQHGDYHDEFVMHVETQTLARTKRNRGMSSLVRMHAHGQLTDEQFVSCEIIIRVAEQIGRNASLRGASMEARVDCSRSGSDALLERIEVVRDEMAYTRWRSRLPMPRRMILDMLLVDRPLAATARRYHVGWPKARRQFLIALDEFSRIREAMRRQVDEDDLSAAHSRLALASRIL